MYEQRIQDSVPTQTESFKLIEEIFGEIYRIEAKLSPVILQKPEQDGLASVKEQRSDIITRLENVLSQLRRLNANIDV
jgi:hypothetical protein